MDLPFILWLRVQFAQSISDSLGPFGPFLIDLCLGSTHLVAGLSHWFLFWLWVIVWFAGSALEWLGPDSSHCLKAVHSSSFCCSELQHVVSIGARSLQSVKLLPLRLADEIFALCFYICSWPDEVVSEWVSPHTIPHPTTLLPPNTHTLSVFLSCWKTLFDDAGQKLFRFSVGCARGVIGDAGVNMWKQLQCTESCSQTEKSFPEAAKSQTFVAEELLFFFVCRWLSTCSHPHISIEDAATRLQMTNFRAGKKCLIHWWMGLGSDV